MQDLNQEQGNSKYYEEEDGWEWLDSYCPRRLANEMRMRGAVVGFGYSGQRLCHLQLGCWWSQKLQTLCASWHAELKEVVQRLRFGEDMRDILKQDFM